MNTQTYPTELTSQNRWVMYDPKNKAPLKSNGTFAKSNDSTTWTSYQLISVASAAASFGVGFVLDASDDIWCIDIDDGIDADGNLRPAKTIMDALATLDTYREKSVSGKGIHIFFKVADYPKTLSNQVQTYYTNLADKKQKIEIFGDGKYVALTGNVMTKQIELGTMSAAQFEKIISFIKSIEVHHKKQAAKKQPTIDTDIFDSINDTPDENKAAADDTPIDVTAYHAHLDTIFKCDDTRYHVSVLREKLKKIIPSGSAVKYHWTANIGMSLVQEVLQEKLYEKGLKTNQAQELFVRICSPFCSEDLQYVVESRWRKYTKYVLAAHPELADDVTQPQAADDKNNTTDKLSPDCFECTDLGNACRMVFYHGDILKYVPNIGWMVYDGKSWRHDDLAARELAKDVVRRIPKEQNNCLRKSKKHADTLFIWGKSSQASARIEAMLHLAESDPKLRLDVKDLDSNDNLLAVQNGTIELNTGVLRPHQSNDYITKISPVIYDPTAQCPQFDTFVNQIFDNNSMLAQYVVDVLGYGIGGDIGIQRFWIFYGNGANGKNTIMNIVKYILGDYFAAASEKVFIGDENQHSHVLAVLQGKRLVCASEAESGAKLRIQTIKRLTGDPTVTANFMHHDTFEYNRKFKCVMLSNNKPRITDHSKGAWRRLRLVPFTVDIPLNQQDTALDAKLRQEASGILNRLIDGYKRAIGSQLVVEPEEVIAATAEYQRESDPVANFIAEKCDCGDKKSVKSSALYGAYYRYCSAGYLTPISQTAFAEDIKRKGFESKRFNDGVKWKGIDINIDAFDLGDNKDWNL